MVLDGGHAGGDSQPAHRAAPAELGGARLGGALSAGRDLCTRPDAGLESSTFAGRDVPALAGSALRPVRPGLVLLDARLGHGGAACFGHRDRAGMDIVYSDPAQPATLVVSFLARF